MKSLAAVFSTITFATFALFSAQASATDPEICQIRGALMGSVAQERDKGVSKAEVKRIFTRKFGGRFSGFRICRSCVQRDEGHVAERGC